MNGLKSKRETKTEREGGGGEKGGIERGEEGRREGERKKERENIKQTTMTTVTTTKQKQQQQRGGQKKCKRANKGKQNINCYKFEYYINVFNMFLMLRSKSMELWGERSVRQMRLWRFNVVALLFCFK